ncbi:MAG TPA: beta-glucosidase [Dehalococcoidia bacterium]|nr:beta-glucosidase [Dehalococcoidia bacterium]
MSFPNDFTWGAATASYQIEGGAYEDGKGLSVWDTFCQQPGKIWGGNTGDVACDHYHRYQEDARLMKELGLKAYRFSVSWPRVLPEGIGVVNEKGLDFYDRLVDALLENGIEPWLTLFHWDYPQSLFQKGGWLNRDSSDWFAEYTGVVVDKLSDRVSHWMTMNEPQVFITIGHQSGYHAPGFNLDFSEVLVAAHNTLLAHGKAVQVIRAHARTRPNVGAVHATSIYFPDTEAQADIEAARNRMFSVREKNCWSNTWFADPMILGGYPEDGLRLFGSDLPEIPDGDMETICQPLDFYGLNNYEGRAVRAAGDGGAEIVKRPDGPPLTTMEWQVTPRGYYWGPRFLFERYRLPIVVTENGMANCDWVHRDGMVHDPQRIDYLARYLGELSRAIEEGVVVKGYFVWTLMDNFEWAFGYRQRFGIVHVDYATQKRTPKDSAYWYKDVIASNGSIL